MRNDTRRLFNAYAERVAQLNGVDSAASKFSVTPTVQQTLENQLQASSEFLSKINVIGVQEQEGEKVMLGVTGTIAGRTDTRTKDRMPRDVSDLKNQGYRCEKTDFDTLIKYQQIDAWAKFPDFQTRLRDAIIKRQALDRILIGFNGVKVAADTDRAANPLLQDVNIGWLQHIRTEAPSHWMKEGATQGKIQVGTVVGCDYANIDALVYDAVMLLEEPYRDATDLVAICGRKLLHDKMFAKLNRDQRATDELASDILISREAMGGLPAIRVPGFPDNAVLVTPLSNLSIYWQEGARRRLLRDRPERDQIENYESSNDAYVVEHYGTVALFENIELKH
ncbi:phage major capsid protein, P2 family [Dyella acidisoli]|uniref:Phage major capsid protein, P2 family n=1 Tax=Dyella acidisoli TaxID=1867834 RepID=A0ABQ5XT09_9GAMM|nr:phage major capsid protein, P2 family [Dyella acidisoli]GLQ93469.1 phage major capsid protein, P2 family [Dyella acidisoli]